MKAGGQTPHTRDLGKVGGQTLHTRDLGKVGGQTPHTRDLDEGELERLVRDLAGQPERWAHLVEHRADARTYAELHRDEHVAVWLICWMDDHDTGYHDHDLSAGAVAVTAGAVREERLALGGAPAARTVSASESFTFGASDIHRVSHAGREPAVTLHAYSPPLWRMGAYEVLPTGELRRWSLSYAEELRPIGARAGKKKGPLAEASTWEGEEGESERGRAGPTALVGIQSPRL